MALGMTSGTNESKPQGSGYTYADAGVSIAAGNALVKAIAPLAKATARPGATSELGGFGGFFDPKAAGYTDPLLVAANDGVGTKLKLAIEHDRHDTVGIDLVAMCVNDLIVQGAEPLFFLDYFATGKLDIDTAAAVVGGIANGCTEAGCALIGGETAEMPDMYPPGEYDLAGFCVAGVEKSEIRDGGRVKTGDVLIGIASSGPHSNGYSLIRRILERSDMPMGFDLGGVSLEDALMAPTRLYVKPVLALLRGAHGNDIHAMAHITGGGITENIIRVIPEGLALDIDAAALALPAVFKWLQQEGGVADAEMWRTFNCGIGFVIVVDAASADAVSGELDRMQLAPRTIGTVIEHADAATERVRIG